MSLSAEEYDAPQHSGPTKTFIDSILEPNASKNTQLTVPYVFCRSVFIFIFKFLKQSISTLFLEWLSDSLGSLAELIDWKMIKRHKKGLQFHQQNPGYRYSPTSLPSPLEAPLTLYKVIQNTKKNGIIMPEQSGPITEKHLSTLRKTNPWLKDILRQSWVMAMQPPLEPASKQNAKALKKNQAKTKWDEPNRGLDDIFTQPILNLFDGDKEFSFSKPAAIQKQPQQLKSKPSPMAARLDKELRHLISLCKKSDTGISDDIAQLKPTSPLGLTMTHEQISRSETSENLSPPPMAESVPKNGFHQDIPSQQALPEMTAKVLPDTTATPLKPESITPSSHNLKPSDGLSRVKAASLDFKKQMPVYQEMKSEISGTEHMARNNRILHNSISKLADAYFQKAAQEAATDS